jgi:uncharacterized protein with PIN domain
MSGPRSPATDAGGAFGVREGLVEGPAHDWVGIEPIRSGLHFAWSPESDPPFPGRGENVAISCPGCGREYDVTLFQFGRTIHCTCGARVGLEARVGPPVTSSEPRFFADAMLGNLARWLRILGFDTAYHPSIPDAELVRRSLAEGRHILTRDRALEAEWRVSHCTVLAKEDVEAQVGEVLQRFGLRDKIRLFTRCTLCNAPLAPLSREEARDRVPARVQETHESFAACPECRRVYWEGSHTQRIRRRLKKILET